MDQDQVEATATSRIEELPWYSEAMQTSRSEFEGTSNEDRPTWFDTHDSNSSETARSRA
jgi:hypothetical protein